jgi:hypothetical protein
MAITVKHSKVSTIPDDADTSLVRPSDWNADHTLVGLGTMAEQNANAVAITGGTATLTSVTTPTVQATNSAGLSLKNSAGTTQISMGAGGGDNITLASSTNINGANAQVDISPTGTGHVHIKPTGVNSVEIAPTYVGEMDNITIGAITPKAGTFTTITGQTEVLKGTGQNLFTQSQTFNTTWNNAALTINQTATTAPDGTSTGNSLTPTVANSIHRILSPALSFVSGITYTVSVYAKANGYNYLYANSNSAFNGYATFNLSNGTVSASGGTTVATITDAGNGWYRCSVRNTATSSSSTTPTFQVNSTQTGATDDTFAGNGTSGIFLWGAQLEIGSTANTYIPTTTTAVYGTPTLSFSGVSEIGLLSNGALYLQPAGTGALQAQATTSSTAGGNARGANAVDWQTSRAGASNVASASASVISGGSNNLANNAFSTVAGGSGNSAQGAYSSIAGGLGNSAQGQLSSIVNGQSNTAAGFYNFIGGGFTNSGTANGTVTTQSATMNGTTAVTLSGSNANIKVGQYVNGTYLSGDTYVAAISGTSLTLSKNASGSGTSTLNFYTPHGVVVGGGNNQATGSYSFIGGGGDAGTAAQRNAATGDWSTVVGGRNNLASGLASFVGGGGTSGDNNTNGNQATAQGSMILGGLGNRATGQGSSVSAGWANQANADFSSVVNGQYGTARSIQGVTVFGSNLPLGYGTGFSQAALFILGRITTDATATVITTNQGGASNNNQVILPNNSAYYFRGEVISGVTGGGDTKGWTIEGVIKRGAGVGTTTLVGTPTVTSSYADAGASTWTIAVTADTTNGGLRVTFTGQAGTTIRTVCSIRSTEMTF